MPLMISECFKYLIILRHIEMFEFKVKATVLHASPLPTWYYFVFMCM